MTNLKKYCYLFLFLSSTFLFIYACGAAAPVKKNVVKEKNDKVKKVIEEVIEEELVEEELLEEELVEEDLLEEEEEELVEEEEEEEEELVEEEEEEEEELVEEEIVQEVVEEIIESEPEPKFEYYTIKRTDEKADTLWGIARSKLKDPKKWKQLFQLNKHLIDNPDLIFPGQKIKIPID